MSDVVPGVTGDPGPFPAVPRNVRQHSAPSDDLARMRRLLSNVLDRQRESFGLRNHLAAIAPLRDELAWAFPATPEIVAEVRAKMDEIHRDLTSDR